MPAVALMGGAALYLLAHVAFRWRSIHRFSTQRLVAAVALLALIPVAARDPVSGERGAAWPSSLGALIVYEVVHFAELRDKMRHQLAHER